MESEVMARVVEVVSPFARNKDALKEVTMESDLIKDLNISSSRLVDIVLELEDSFSIEIKDSEADKVNTIGAAVNLIISKTK